MKKTKPHLEPCPFCGTAADTSTCRRNGVIDSYRVYCPAPAEECPAHPMVWRSTLELAAEAWNTRKGAHA